jgi:hypothetical protein
MARTLSSLQTWAYSLGEEEVWINLYGGSKLDTQLFDQPVKLTQTTNYPWDGSISIRVDACPNEPFSLALRIPGWCQGARVSLNGAPWPEEPKAGTYVKMKHKWRRGDHIELNLPMPVRLSEAHPNINSNRNRIAVMRGPVLYCVELPISEEGKKVWDNGIYFPENIDFKPRFDKQLLGGVVVLEANALTSAGKERFLREVVANAEPVRDDRSWEGVLYRPFHGRKLTEPTTGMIPLTLIPYYAWANRGEAFMQVWTPLAR